MASAHKLFPVTMSISQNEEGRQIIPATATPSNMKGVHSHILKERSPNQHTRSHEMTKLRRVVSADESTLSPVKSLQRSLSDRQEHHKSRSEPVSPVPSDLLSDENKLAPTLADADTNDSFRRSNRTTIHQTILSALLSEERYVEANRRVREHPEEAAIWVQQSPPYQYQCPHTPLRETRDSESAVPVRKEPSSDITIFCERLPIHIACGNLALASDSKLRFQLEQLILRLALAYPEGCSQVDKCKDHRLPLHEAIWNNATPETVSILLMADPSSMYHKDACGRNAAEANRHGCGVFVDQIRDLLSLGIDFWEDARRKAEHRFGYRSNLENIIPQTEESVCYPSICFAGISDPTAYDSSLTVDLESDSIISESPFTLLENRALYPQRFGQREIHLKNKREMSRPEEDGNTRAEILQNMLSELYEKNLQLTATVTDLANQNATLRTRVLEPDIIQPQLNPNFYNVPMAATNTTELLTLRAQNTLLQQEVNRLKEKRRKQTNKIRYLKNILTCTGGEDALVDFSETESATTCSLLSHSLTTNFSAAEMTPFVNDNNVDDDDDNNSLVANSLQRCLASKSINSESIPVVNSKSSNRAYCITGLAAYKMTTFVSRLQRKIGSCGEGVDMLSSSSDIPDDVEQICKMAAAIYSDHVKESSWRCCDLVLQWEAPNVETQTLVANDRERGASNYSNTDLYSIASFSETSLMLGEVDSDFAFEYDQENPHWI